MLCGPWIVLAEEAPYFPATLCSSCVIAGDGPITPALLQAKIFEASYLGWMASGRQFGGICTDRIDPCEDSPVTSAAVTWRNNWPTFEAFTGTPSGGGCGCGGTGSCVGGAVTFPYVPVRSIEAVTIDGDVLAPSAYTLWNGRWLVRNDGHGWPCSQSPAWSIDYTWGNVPDLAGLGAVLAMACEMAKACTDQACALPSRIRTLTTEGTTIDVADPLEFLEQGRFGFYPMDLWLSQVNPAGIDRAAKVINVDLLGDTIRRA